MSTVSKFASTPLPPPKHMYKHIPLSMPVGDVACPTILVFPLNILQGVSGALNCASLLVRNTGLFERLGRDAVLRKLLMFLVWNCWSFGSCTEKRLKYGRARATAARSRLNERENVVKKNTTCWRVFSSVYFIHLFLDEQLRKRNYWPKLAALR